MLKLAVSGARGRMGQTIIKLALADKKNFRLATLLEHKNHPDANIKINGVAISTDNHALKSSDVLIEFTLPEGTMENLAAAVKHNVKMVIGTTGLSEAQIKKIKAASAKIPIVFASNMSIGVNVLFKLIQVAGAALGPSAITITETHHIHKKDKPSGTAKTMAQLAEKASGIKISSIDAIRKGEVVGDHDITFDTPEDILTISHHAKDRSMFAKGALTAALFLKNKKKGLFNMQDVLGLK